MRRNEIGTSNSCNVEAAVSSGKSVFFRLFGVGGSLLYCISALSIVWGLSEVVKPIFRESGAVSEKILCVGAVNLYELLLIGMVLVLILWKGIRDDAVSLVVISALFFTIGGILVGVIATDALFPALIAGVVTLILAGGRLYALKKYARISFGYLIFAGISLILIWNYLTAYFISAVHSKEGGLTAENVWRYGWLLMLSGAFLMLLELVTCKQRYKDESGIAKEKIGAFLNRSEMGWIFAVEILVAATVHQYMLSYIFDLSFKFGDLLPVIMILFFLILEYMRIVKSAEVYDIFPAIMPFFIITAAIFFRMIPNVEGFAKFLWSPGILFLSGGIWVLIAALRSGRKVLHYCWPLYMVGFLLVGGSRTGITGDTQLIMNWKLAGSIIFSATVIYSIIKRRMYLLAFSLMALPLTVLSIPGAELILAKYNCSRADAGCVFVGVSILAMWVYFKDEFPSFAGIVGAVFFAIGTMGLAGNIFSIRMIICGVVAVSAGLFLFRIAGLKTAAIIVSLPVFKIIYLNLSCLRGWHFILLSFLLLGAGGLFSLKKAEIQASDSDGRIDDVK